MEGEGTGGTWYGKREIQTPFENQLQPIAYDVCQTYFHTQTALVALIFAVKYFRVTIIALFCFSYSCVLSTIPAAFHVIIGKELVMLQRVTFMRLSSQAQRFANAEAFQTPKTPLLWIPL